MSREVLTVVFFFKMGGIQHASDAFNIAVREDFMI